MPFAFLLFILMASSGAQGLNFRPSPVALREGLVPDITKDIDNASVEAFDPKEEDELNKNDKPISFILKSLKLEQASVVLDPELVQQIVRPLINQTISSRDLMTMAQLLTKLYYEKGYIFSRVYLPFQDLRSGKVSLKAIEGNLDAIGYRWINMPSDPKIKAIIDQLREIKPFTTQALEEVVAKIRRIPGVSVSFTLKPRYTNQENKNILIVILARQGVTYQSGISDKMPKDMGKWIAEGSLQFNSPFGQNETLKLYGAIYPTHKFNSLMFYGADLGLPISDFGTKLHIFGDMLRSKPNLGYQGLETARGKLVTLGLGLSQEVMSSYDFHMRIKAQIDRKTFRESTQATGGARTDLYEKNLAVRLSADMEHKDQDYGHSHMIMTYHQGANDSWSRKRGTADAGRLNFKKITARLDHTFEVMRNFELYGMVRGQYALSTPLEMEKFFYGGAPSSLAHTPGMLSGDHGMHTKLEVRYGVDLGEFAHKLVAYGYYQTATRWNRPHLGVRTSRETLNSTGFGLRGHILHGLSMFVEYAIPLKVAFGQNKLRRNLFAGISMNNSYSSSLND